MRPPVRIGYLAPATAALAAAAVLAGCGGGGGGHSKTSKTSVNGTTTGLASLPAPPTAAGPPSSVGTTPPPSTVKPPSKSGGQKGPAVAAGTAAGKKVFVANSCGTCHAFPAAGASGAAEGGVGPNLATVPAKDAKKAGMSYRAFIQRSIVDPNAYISKGYRSHLMPTNFGKTLSKSELNELVTFLVKNGSGGGK